MQNKLQREKANNKYTYPLSLATFEKRERRDFSPEGLDAFMQEIIEKAIKSKAISLTQFTLELGLHPDYWNSFIGNHPQQKRHYLLLKSIIGTRAHVKMGDGKVRESAVLPYLDDFLDEFKESTARTHKRSLEKAHAAKTNVEELPFVLVKNKEGKLEKHISVNENKTYEEQE